MRKMKKKKKYSQKDGLKTWYDLTLFGNEKVRAMCIISN